VEALSTEIDAVTSATYGSLLSVTSTVITEKAISWATIPQAVVATDYLSVNISGATNDTAFVYLAIETNGSTGESTTSTTVTTTTTTTETTVNETAVTEATRVL
jgi:hypothetical protein